MGRSPYIVHALPHIQLPQQPELGTWFWEDFAFSVYYIKSKDYGVNLKIKGQRQVSTCPDCWFWKESFNKFSGELTLCIVYEPSFINEIYQRKCNNPQSWSFHVCVWSTISGIQPNIIRWERGTSKALITSPHSESQAQSPWFCLHFAIAANPAILFAWFYRDCCLHTPRTKP